MNAAEFIKRYTEQGYAASDEAVARLADASFREEIYRHLHSSVSPSDGVLLQELLIQEISARRKHSDDEFHENLYWCAFLLYQVGDVQDIELLWEAKNIDFDTACSFDVQFLVGGESKRPFNTFGKERILTQGQHLTTWLPTTMPAILGVLTSVING